MAIRFLFLGRQNQINLFLSAQYIILLTTFFRFVPLYFFFYQWGQYVTPSETRLVKLDQWNSILLDILTVIENCQKYSDINAL